MAQLDAAAERELEALEVRVVVVGDARGVVAVGVEHMCMSSCCLWRPLNKNNKQQHIIKSIQTDLQIG